MVFRDTQLGRFGALCTTHFGGHTDLDVRAAHALASDGVSSPANPARPNVHDVLLSKTLSEDGDAIWTPWANQFSGLSARYGTSGGRLLVGRCTRSWAPHPPGFCMHEFTPPLQYWSMRNFAVHRMNITNVVQRADGTMGVDTTVQPLWNYILTSRGEILVASEDFGWVKHTSIAGGNEVWAAGQIGIENSQLRLIDLQSGHYILGNITPGSVRAKAIIQFTDDVFKRYFKVFSLPNLHSLFQCIWG
jgi:hypothetical protein